MTVLARAAGYSDALLTNVVVEGPSTELGVLRLVQGGYVFDAGVGGGATTTPRCGDGVVGLDEVCDDANTIQNDGCSRSCALEFQQGGGTWCLDATRAKLVPVANGQLAAILQVDGVGSGKLSSSCIVDPVTTFAMHVPHRGLLSAQSH